VKPSMRGAPSKRPSSSTRLRAKVPEVIYIHRDASPPGSRNGWWYQDCPKHGTTPHLDVLGGRCEQCQRESLDLKTNQEPKP
jgi:hypothetical protein